MSSKQKRDFHKELILNQWLLSFFHGASLKALKERLGDDRFEGLEEDGQTKFFYELQRNLFQLDKISEAKFRKYDLNIVRYWNKITERRNRVESTVLNLKYFQYLSLLFTEIYLDWYFNKKQEMFNCLNEQVEIYNKNEKPEWHFQKYDSSDLNKIAYWNATGSGKTLLLQVNIFQYLYYFQSGNNKLYPDNIILLTPNEGLSNQHLSELEVSGFFSYELFDGSKSNSAFGTIKIIDIKKLGDEAGIKTVAVESFEGNNLVLVDEGHLGAGTADGPWMRRRETLISNGFAFEYSATFGQAVSKSKTIAKSEEEYRKKKAKILFDTKSLNKLTDDQLSQLKLTQDEKKSAKTDAMREVYAKCVLFDYSYKYFYHDGYGKESLILNLNDKDYEKEDQKHLYFTACLLSFYQQLYLWNLNKEKIAEFNIEKPLWVFVGNTVNSEGSDVLEVIKFLALFLNKDQKSRAWIEDLKSNTARLLDSKGRNIFQNRFTPLISLSTEEIYSDILKKLFNADSKQRLKLINLKSAKGEHVLQVGESEPFGLINIGDGSDFFKIAESEQNNEYFDTRTDDFDSSLFGGINKQGNKLNVLIGSRKFTEGWSSWRVSTMGLLNMGKCVGPQIIQLFGRGVRLKGRDYSLKRSTPSQRPKGLHLEKLETLNIFGVNAGYMATFKEYLNEEGVITSDEIIEIDFKTRANLPKNRLNTLSIKDGYKDNQRNGFKRTYSPWLYDLPKEFEGKIKKIQVELDLYPKIEAIKSGNDKASTDYLANKQEASISKEIMHFFDFDRIYLKVQEFKQKSHYSNLKLDRSKLIDFCVSQNNWYRLYIPTEELKINSFADVRKQEDILIELLELYTARFYKSLKSAYESQFYDIIQLKEDHASMLKLYHFEIENTEDGLEYEKRIKILQELINEGKLDEASKWKSGSMAVICFDSHLYYPLFDFEQETDLPLKMRPLSFDNEYEIQFVKDLQTFYESPATSKRFAGKNIYLLRNASHKSKGLGFALAGNFYPDFLLWVVENNTGKQFLNFIDPKGLRQISLNDPKFGLYKEVKTIQEKLNDPNLELNAFILSHTKFDDLINVSCKQEELEDRNVLFMSDGRDAYLGKMFDKIA